MITRALLTDGKTGLEININFDVPQWAYTGETPGRLIVTHYAHEAADEMALHLIGPHAWHELITVNGTPYAY